MRIGEASAFSMTEGAEKRFNLVRWPVDPDIIQVC